MNSLFRLRTLTLAFSFAILSLNAATQLPADVDVTSLRFCDLAFKGPDVWYKTRQARQVADTVLAYQFPSGGWAKNQNWQQNPDGKKMAERAQIRKQMASETGIGPTIDNHATTQEMCFLARLYKATHKKAYREAFMRGLDYLVEAQYDNGGWPQYYPVKTKKSGPDYSRNITYNDDAMVNVMKLMRDIARGKAPYDALRLSAGETAKAQESYEKGIRCMVETQVWKNGQPTVWCQQHDPETLKPVNARAFELASLTGCNETPEILRMLMDYPNPDESIIRAVCGAVDWLKSHAIHNRKLEKFTNAQGKKDIRLVEADGAPDLWARYYDLDTGEPFFCDRDGVKRARLDEVGYERRNGYTWLDNDVQSALDRFPAWYNKHCPGNFQEGDYYLYCHMNDAGPAYTAYALSKDGFHYHDLLNGDSIFADAEVAEVEGRSRDAYICRMHDGRGYLMCLTDLDASKQAQKRLGKIGTWDNYAIILLKSDDLIHWTHKVYDFRKGRGIFCNPDDPAPYKDYSTVNRVWAPQVVWDNNYVWPDGRKGAYFMYYSLWNRAEEEYDRMYYSYVSEDFTQVTQPKLLFDWGYATIDADINWIAKDSLWHMMIKKEGGQPGLFTATARNLTGPWGEPVADDYVNFEGNKKCEGVSAFQLKGDTAWTIGYIEYSSKPRNYRICKANSLMRGFNSPRNIEGVDRPQHGSFMRITKDEYERLEKWSLEYERQHNAPDVNNPVLNGLFADPEILWSEKNGRYYLYPTTDGCEGWNNHDFKCYSSTDLKTWADEGTIIDLRTDISWADSKAWAPCIIERKYGEGKKAAWKYFYYFVANGKIGVAVADDPAGPFKDALGRPLLDKSTAEVKDGQVIDPDVFLDPQTGKYYLYWGNGNMVCCELGDDMTSIVSTRLLIAKKDRRAYGYNEGTYVFYRNGKYYFTWSENDTRSKNYRVRYLISDSATELVRDGKPAEVEKTVLLAKDPAKQIYGTGHHAILQVPGTDKWYIVYHRFARPDAVHKDWSAGYNREVCIDELHFNEDGTLVPVKPTL